MRRSRYAISSFLSELRRRHVFRVALGYSAVAWIILQVSATLFPALRLPDWSVTLVAVLVILGFPVALLLARVFDFTPEGFLRTVSPPRPAAGSARPDAAAGPGPRIDNRDSARPASLRSVVALPLVDRSPEGDYQFLGDGITEELIHGLARVEGLRVVSRTSAFAFRGQPVEVREIGARLGVGSVVEGSIRVSGDRLRMVVQLVKVEEDYAIWSATFDRRIEDVFAVQEEVARSIVDTIREKLAVGADSVPLPAGNGAPLLRTTTRNVDAYTLYLRGRAQWNERTPASLRRAIEYFERAVAEDPGYAHAHAGLADCYAILLDYGIISPAEGLGPARAAVERALHLGAGIAESHTSAALVRQMEWDWKAADEEFRTALDVNPGYAAGRHRYALLLAWLGRIAESRREIERARRLDPLSPIIGASVGWIEYYAGDFEKAIHAVRETLAEHPRFGPARVPLALACLQTGRMEEAVSELERAVIDSGDTSSTLSLLAYALARSGRIEEARERQAILHDRAGREYVSPYYRAIPLLGTGDDRAALLELERAAAERAPQLIYLRMEHLFDPLRPREEFRRLLDRVGFPAGPG